MACLTACACSRGAPSALPAAPARPERSVRPSRRVWVAGIARLAANLGSGEPPPVYEAASCLLPLLAALLEIDDTEVLQHVLVPLAELSGGSRERIRAVAHTRGVSVVLR